MSGSSVEEIGIRLNAQGVVEATNGVSLMGKASGELGKQLDQTSRSGQSFLQGLRDQIATYGRSSDEILKYRAAQAGVAADASHLILQLQNMRAAQQLSADAAREQATAQDQAARAGALLAAQQLSASVVQRAQAESKAAFLQSLKDEIATFGASREEVIRYEAAMKGISQSALEPLIAKLRELREAEQAATQARQEAAAAARAQATAEQEAQRVLQAEVSTQQAFLASLRDQAALLGKTRTEVLAYRAAHLGVSEEAEGSIRAIADFDRANDQAAESAGRNGKSSRELSQAMRLLPAQITDVVTSLASGSPVWLVAIQQGGQIKDSFGGIVPAARALLGAISPVGLALGVIGVVTGVVVTALVQAERETEGYTRAIIMNGNAAGTNAGQLQDMARAISASVGTQGKAAEALTDIAATGEVARRNLQAFSETGVRIERSLGQPLQDTARHFTDLGRAPLEATLELNKGLNYLTAATYDQIRALMAQGQVQAAGEVAQKAYAAAMDERSAKVQDNLGMLQRAAQATGGFFKRMWDGVLDIGREDTLQQKADFLTKALAKARSSSDPRDNWLKGRERENNSMLNSILQAQQFANQAGEADAANTAAAKEAIRQRETALIEAHNAVTVAQAQAAATQQEAIGARSLAIAQAQADARQTLIQREQATLESLHDADQIGLSDYYKRRAELEKGGLNAQIELVDEQISVEGRLSKARLDAIAVQMQAESRRQPADDAGALQQQAQEIALGAQYAEAQIQSETKVIALKSQRAQLVAQQMTAEVAADRAISKAGDDAAEAFDAQITQRRASLEQYLQQMKQANASAAAGLIADPFVRAQAQAEIAIRELTRTYEQQVAGLKIQMTQLQTVDPQAAQDVQQQIVAAERQKADAIVLINREMVEQLKPEYQKNLEAWADSTRLMRDTYNDFQLGLQQTGMDTWVEFTKTGELSFKNLKDFALGELGKLEFKAVIAPQLAKAGDALLDLFNIPKPDAPALTGVAAETAARSTLTTGMGSATLAVNALSSAATAAAQALAGTAASSGGSGFLGLFGLKGTSTGSTAGSTPDPFKVSGPEAHTGALIGGGFGEGRSVRHAASTWTRAPRLHTGGLASDEVPAILQRGEGVFTKGQMKSMAPVSALARIAGGQTIHFNPIINIDARTDQAQVAQLVNAAMKQSRAELLDDMSRRRA